MIDFTIQRELPGNMIAEVGYIGRLGSRLASSMDLDASPYLFKDQASGQTFAQAFDNVACVLRGMSGQTVGSFQCPAAVTNQPWFENQVAGGTAAVVNRLRTPLINGDVFTTFFTVNTALRPAGQPSFNNLQLFAFNLLENSKGHSGYHALFATLHKRISQGLQFDMNYTFSKSLDQQGQIDNNVPRLATPFNPDLQYGPSSFDHRHIYNLIYNYDLPFGRGHRLSAGHGINHVIGGWYTAGIFTASSGFPVTVTQGANQPNFGGGLTGSVTGATADIQTASLSTGVHTGVTGSGGCGTSGTRINFFADPFAACNAFRVPLLSVDTRTGESRPLYGLGFWNMDARLGKVTTITERLKVEISADAFNVFNVVNFATPTLSLSNPATFGVITGTQTLANHSSPARYLQLGLRLSF